jgi:hypothetical protein
MGKSLNEVLYNITRPTRDAQLAALLNQIEHFKPDAWDCEKIIEVCYGSIKKDARYSRPMTALVAMVRAMRALEQLDQGGEPDGYEELCDIQAYKDWELKHG